jgi:Domain of unknown function (DUF222)/HNH endonuclease
MAHDSVEPMFGDDVQVQLDRSGDPPAAGAVRSRPFDANGEPDRADADRRTDLIARADRLHELIGRSMRELFALLVAIDRSRAWDDDGARDLVHWTQMRYGISAWKAHRWIDASYALEALPQTAHALETGELGADKVLELARFATPASEPSLLAWAETVSAGAIRRRAELEARRDPAASSDVDRERRCRWWLTDEGRRMELLAELPAADGALVADAIERAAAELPEIPGEDRAETVEARRADALVALCAGSRMSTGPHRASIRPRIVVHAPLDALVAADDQAGSAELTGEGPIGLHGGVIDGPVLRRLACDAEFQVLLEDAKGEPLRLGRAIREPTAALAKAVRARDRECRFPACGARRHTDVHHIVWWSRGGVTDVDNLVLLCSFHHRLVHEHGWGLRRTSSGVLHWIRSDGSRYRAGPSPPFGG